MTVDERLSEWLEQTTPEPPRAVTVEDIERFVVPRRLAWPPLLAAACVLAIAAVAVLVATRGTKHDAEPPSRPTTTRTTPPPHLRSNTPPAPAPNADLPVTPWGAHVVTARPHGDEGDLVSYGTSVYTTSVTGLTIAVERIDPATGLTLARSSPSIGGIARDLVFVDGSVWLAVESHSTAYLRALDPLRLTPQRRLPSVTIGPGSPIHLAAAGSTIFLASGHNVTAFDTRTGAVTRRYHVPGSHLIGAIAVHGDRLFLGTAFGAGGGELHTFNVTNGSLLDTDPHAGSITGITATSGGLWVSTAGGMSAAVNFNGRFVQPGGGGVRPTIGIFGNTAWLGGTGFVQCADPDTGAVRAHAPLTRGKAQDFIFDIVVNSGRVFAWAVGDNGYQYLVELHPPKACG